jgi:peptidoglycan/xylan/chitin deacetylase (PgdA/CDA1 family)
VRGRLFLVIRCDPIILDLKILLGSRVGEVNGSDEFQFILDIEEGRQMKNTQITVVIMLSLAALSLTGCWRPAPCDTELSVKSGQTAWKGQEDFHWPKGKRAAISLTFDDARVSQLDRGLPILDAYGVKATFYVVPRNVQQRVADWKKAAANGHEIANHSLKHPCTGNFSWSREKALENYTLEEMGHELDEASAAVEDLLGVSPATFAYPCGQKFVGWGLETKSYVPLVAERFVVGRGAFDEVANDPAFCDLAQATGIDLDCLDFEQAKQLVDQAIAEGRWLIFFGHDVGERRRQTTIAATVEALCEYAQDPANGLWIDRVATIGKYIQQQRVRGN